MMDDRQLDVVEEILKLQSRLDAQPPSPDCIIARYDVPRYMTRSGQPFRMWDARGRLIWFMHRGLIDELPRTERKDTLPVHQSLGITFGIPVICEGPDIPHVAYHETRESFEGFGP
jgi:hypothetical protein